MASIEEKLKQTKIKLDSIAPHFCAAKWLQVTLHLHLGQNHSCHHPGTHHIPKECVSNPSLLHNTPYKKIIWGNMLSGDKINECAYCNNMEDEGNIYSDRILKSTEDWASPYIEDIINNPFVDINPTYVEVNFSHVCNCQCAYCSPWISSSWEKDVIDNGHYPTSRTFGKLDPERIPIDENNIYKQAFWEWWPDLVKTLHHFRITGGEPLLHKDTFKIMDYLLETPQPNLNFSVNTNLCVDKKLIDKFLDKCEQLIKNKCVKQLHVYSSCEAYKDAAEYSRWGLKYDYWWKYVDKLLEIENIKFGIMATYNIFSVVSFLNFIQDVYKRKLVHGRKIVLDVPFLRHPQFLCADILTTDFLKYTNECLEFMGSNQEDFHEKFGFMQFEYDKFKRIYKSMETAMKNDHSIVRHDFYIFINEWDKRKKLNFLDVFPQYEKFYMLCQEY
jgi:organic radical activating enzyme